MLKIIDRIIIFCLTIIRRDYYPGLESGNGGRGWCDRRETHVIF